VVPARHLRYEPIESEPSAGRKVCSAAAHVVRHDLGDDQGQFDQALILAVLEPGGLIDQRPYALFLDGVDIGPAALQEVAQLAASRFGVAIEDGGTQQVTAPLLLSSTVVHRHEDPLAVTHLDRSGKFLHPAVVHGRAP